MLTRFLRWLADRFDPVQPAPAVVAELRPEMFTTDRPLDERFDRATRLAALQARALPTPTLRTVAMDGTVVAMDAANCGQGAKGAYTLGEIGAPELTAQWYGLQSFIGYQLCAIMAQHWFIDKACRMPARDAIRKGYKFTVNDGQEVGADVIEAITRANKRYRLNRSLVEFVRMGRVFGIRVALTVVQSDDPDYYVKPFNPDGITPGSYRGISQIDPYWVIPELTTKGASDPAAIDFYEPSYWIVNGVRIHKSHLVIMKGPEVADVLKPSYLYGGMSIPQLIYERVYAAERTANEAPQLALTKRADILYTNTSKVTANPAGFIQKLMEWRGYLDNYGVKVFGTDDKVERLDTSLADLDAVIMTQYQLACSVAGVPSTKMLGTAPKGFNSTGEYETENYHEELETIQVNDMEPLIDRHMVCLIRSEIAPRFGIKPFSVECTWEPLSTLTTTEQAAVNKTKAETDKILSEVGALDGMDVRKRVATDELSGHTGMALALEEPDDGATDPQAA